MEKEFLLKYKDLNLGVIGFDGDDIVNCKLYDESRYFPFGVSDNGKLKDWVRGREIPASRHGWKTDLGTLSRTQFLLSNYGLSLTDSFWLCPMDNRCLSWKDVNLYKNGFVDNWFLSEENMGTNVLVPSSSLQGNLKKKWVCQQDKRFLIKANIGNTSRSSLNEVLAAKINKLQKFENYVEYTLVSSKQDSDLFYSKCVNFVEEGEELVHAIHIVNSGKKDNRMNQFSYYVNTCCLAGIKKEDLLNHMSYLIMIDFVISNNDRHLENLGIVRNVETGGVRIAPIYDNGNSMFLGLDYIPTSEEDLLQLTVNSFYSKEVNMLKLVTAKSVVKTELLPADTEVFKLYKRDSRIPEEMIERMCSAYSVKCKLLEDFQNGRKLWENPKYKK